MFYDFMLLFYNIFRPLEVIMDSDIIRMPNKRAVLSDDINEKNCIDTDVAIIESSKNIVGLKNTTVIDSCITQVPSSQDISKENDLPNSLKVSDKNKFNMKIQNNAKNPHSDYVENNMNNLHSDPIENIVTSNKRKISNFDFITNNDDNNLFDYMDIEEVKLPSKKLKTEDTKSIIQPIPAVKQYTDSIIQPIPSTSSSIRTEQFTFEKSKPIQAINSSNIMNLLADVKGTGQFIDANKLPDISVKI